METYKITFKTQLANCWVIILYFLIIPIGYCYLMSRGTEEQNIKVFLEIFISIFLFHLIFLLIQHLNYYSLNKNDILLCNKNMQDFAFIHNGVTTKFTLPEIKKVILSRSFALDKNNIQMLSWDGYNHASIFLDNGKKIIVTSLLLPDVINIPVDESKIEKKLNFLRIVKGPSLSLPLK